MDISANPSSTGLVGGKRVEDMFVCFAVPPRSFSYPAFTPLQRGVCALLSINVVRF
jgi:hypothetical protein